MSTIIHNSRHNYPKPRGHEHASSTYARHLTQGDWIITSAGLREILWAPDYMSQTGARVRVQLDDGQGTRYVDPSAVFHVDNYHTSYRTV